MCSPPNPPKVASVPKQELPPPPPPPEPTAEAPVVNEGSRKKRSDDNTVASKKTGTSSLRIDLAVPTGGSGLNIPS